MDESMTRQEVLDLVRKEIANQSSASRFQLTPTSRHIHNNVDAPFAFQPQMPYVGIIQYDGVQLAMPKGWTVTYDGTGEYTITHNLNSILNVVMVAPIISTTLPVADVLQGPNEFTIAWTDTGTPVDARAAVDTTFSFLLMDAVNSNTNPPVYTFRGY